MKLAITIGCFIIALTVSASADAVDETGSFSARHIEFFERHVRPVLQQRCISCHGPKKQEAGLRLDSRGAILTGSENGAVVKLKEPAASKLIEAIGYKAELKMPPKGRLKQQEIDALAEWVRLGLPWPNDRSADDRAKSRRDAKNHWAFQPIKKPPLPHVSDAPWARTAIDHFILAELDSRELTPSEITDRGTLIRRATFDLTGLPPTPDEVAAFLADDSPRAFEKLVDRLLASPRYGERWGRHWLDVARYADNKGYVFFEEKKFPWAYTYRDYVIQSFNDDLPYDQFVLEQIAADQLGAGKDGRRLAAMGFLTLGARFMNNTHDVIDDQIDVVTRGLMSLTVTCARCHDHKYDPIPQADYYSLYGVMRSSAEPTLPPLLEAPPETEQYKKFAVEMEKREKKLNDFVKQKHRELVDDARTRIGDYLLAAYEQRNQPRTDDFMLLTDKGALNPTMILRWQVYLEKSRNTRHPVWSPWHRLAELSETEFAGKVSEVLEDLGQRRINSLVWREVLGSGAGLQPAISSDERRQDISLPHAPTSMREVIDRYGRLLKQVNDKWQQALKVAKEKGDETPSKLDNPAEEELRQVLYGHDAPPDVAVSFGWGFLALFPDRPTQGEYKKLLKELETWSMTGAGAPARAMVLFDTERPFEPRIFLRGNPHRQGAAVPRQFLQVFDANRKPFRQGSGRLELARSIVDPTNPLTARAIVNRLWLHHFGQGLVRTPSDFGLRSDPPTHPKLLDYLATSLIESGWSIKAVQRLIMTSAVYQQSSADRPSCLSKDPENRLLWKMNRRRLDFEAMRDALLAATNDLDDRLGGPPVDLFAKPLVPRRSVYGFIDRMDLSPLLSTFDFPNPVATSPARETTTVAPQSLYLMNSAFVEEASRRIANRGATIQDSKEKVQQLYRLLFGRLPTNGQSQLAVEYLGSQPSADDWNNYTHALIMTNEFVFVD